MHAVLYARNLREGENMGKKSKYFAVILTVMVFCLGFAVVSLAKDAGSANAADNTNASQVSNSTVAVHDPSIVVAYEDEKGNTFGEQNEQKTLTKVYYVFGTQIANAKSYDLINWTSFTNNLNDGTNLYNVLGESADYSGLSADTVVGNSWAPDVIWNKDLGKWCMYLSVNGSKHNSSIVMLMADNLDGNWSKAGTVVWSGFTTGNVGSTDYEKVMGTTEIDWRHNVTENGYISYAAHAIDPCVFYDQDGQLWMSYGSWRGGVFLLQLNNYTGLRDYAVTYETVTEGTVANDSRDFTVYSDQYFGKHIAGGAGISGEGPYIVYNNGYYYLFVTYGGVAPDQGYNMRYFRSKTVDGEYVDATGETAIYKPGMSSDYSSTYGIRVMSGYTWKWWDFNYIGQGHNSVFVDDDGKMYIVYHNKYTDGTIFHVMKVHQLYDDGSGWLVTAPFESHSTDSKAADKSKTDIAGTYGAFIMTYNNGTYSDVCKEAQITFDSSGNISGAYSGSWTYANDGTMTLTIDGKIYKGYLLNQTLEGTNIQTLSISALYSTTGETFWAYKYPSNVTAGSYGKNMTAVPDSAETTLLADSYSFSDPWYSSSVTMTKTSTGYEGDGYKDAITASDDAYATYDSVSYGQAFLAMPGLSGGFSISFDYEKYNDDWTAVLTGNNTKVHLSVMQYNEGGTWRSIFEAAAVAGNFNIFADAAYQAFYSRDDGARATISFNTDGTITFYRNGVKVLTYLANTTFNDTSYTVAQFNQAVIAELKAGTLKSAYEMKNVVIDAPYDIPATGPMDIQLSGGINLVQSAAGAIKSGTAFNAVSNATSAGVAVSFYLSKPITAAYKTDWNSTELLSSGNYKIRIPNLDRSNEGNVGYKGPENKNLYGASSYGGFYYTTGLVTVSVNTDGSIVYYLNGGKMIKYNAGDSVTDGSNVQAYASGLLSQISGNSFNLFNSVSGAKDVMITNALTDAQAAQLFEDYRNYQHEYLQDRDYDYGDSGINVISAISNSAAIATTAFPAVSNADSAGIAVSFEIAGNLTSDWSSVAMTAQNYKITLPNLDPYNTSGDFSKTHAYPVNSGNTNNFVNGGTWNAFLNTTCYVTVSVDPVNQKISYYKNGVKVIEYSGTDQIFEREISTNQWEKVSNTVSEFISAFLSAVKSDGVGFGFVEITESATTYMQAKNVTLTNAVTEEQAAVLYSNRNAVGGGEGGHDCDTEGHSYTMTRMGNACEGYVETYTCTYCGDTYTVNNTSGVTGHKYTLEFTDSTCTQTGLAKYTCSACNDVVQAVVPLKEHTPKTDGEGNAVWHYDENGETAGHWQVCSVCNDKINEDDHTWDAGVTTKEPTCTETGIGKDTCTICGYSIEVTLSAKGHSPATEMSYNETQHWYECTACHEKLEVADHTRSEELSHDADSHWYECTDDCGCQVAKTAHDWEETSRVDATCETDGKIYYSCVCGETKTETISATGHVKSDTMSCDETQHWYECTVCGEKINAEAHTVSDIWSSDETNHWHACTADCGYVADTAAHSWDEGEVTTPATEDQEGVMTYTCTVCNKTKEVKFTFDGHAASDVYGHDDEYHWFVCEVEGCSEHQFDKTAHAWGEGVVTTEPTCIDKGVRTYTCVCGATRTEEIPATGEHNVDTEHWVTDDTSHWHACTTEGCTYTEDKAEHSFGEGTVTKEPACDEKGEKTYTCSECGKTVTEEIAALGHNYVFSEKVEPDFANKTDGYDLYVCENDPSHTEKRNIVEWETLGATVTFNSNGGSSVSSVTVAKGATVSSLKTPTRNGYTFAGWYVDSAFKTAFTTSTKVNANMTVYARWLVNVIETDDDEEVEIKVENPAGFEEDVKITVVDKTAEEHGFTIENGKIDKVYEVTVNAEISGTVTVTIFVGDSFDDGLNTVYIADAEGILATVEYEYADGYVTIDTDELGTFVFASPVVDEIPEPQPEITPDKDGGNGAVIAVCILCAAISLAAIASVVIVAVKKKQRNF